MLVIITWIALPVSFPAENLYVLIIECMCSRLKELPYVRWMYFGWKLKCLCLSAESTSYSAVFFSHNKQGRAAWLWANCSLWIGISAAPIQSFSTSSRLLSCCMIRECLVSCHFTGERDGFCPALFELASVMPMFTWVYLEQCFFFL